MTKNWKRSRWVDYIGDWKYMCHVLAQFDPIRADTLYNTCTHTEILEAFRSMKAFNKLEEK